MNILILVESLAINDTSSGIVSSNFINALESQGNSISILMPDEFAPGRKNPFPRWLNDVHTTTFQTDTKPNIFEKILNKIPKIRALPAYIIGFSLPFKRLILKWKEEIEKKLYSEKYDLIIVLGTGSSFAPHFAMNYVKTDIPWIANIHDPYPMNHYPEPYKKPYSLIYGNQARHLNKVFEKATYVTFPSQRLMEWMSSFHSQLRKKAFVVPHAACNISSLPSLSRDNAIHLSSDKFNLLHAGSLLGPRNPKYLIKAFLRFINEDKERKDKAVLNIIGKIAREHEGFSKEYEKVKDNVNIIIERVSYKHSLELLKKANVLVLLEAVGNDSPFMPGKLTDYISVNKPILALTPPASETVRLLGDDYPYITETDNEEKIYQILIRLWTEWKSGNLRSNLRPDLLEYVSANNVNKIVMENIKICTS